MAVRPQKKYPPYMGSDPYFFLSFQPDDASRVMPLMKKLAKRGIRFYYVTKKGKNDREAAQINERISHASFMVFLIGDKTYTDNRQKGFGQHFEKSGKPFLVLSYSSKTGQKLGTGFSTNPAIHRISLGKDVSEAEDQILHAEGFTYDFFGRRDRHLFWKKFFIFAGIFAILAVAGLYAYVRVQAEKAKELENVIVISDPVILAAAESEIRSLGESKLTKSNASLITFLTLPELPASFEDLAKFPNLHTINADQKIASSVLSGTDNAYSVLLVDGGAK